MGWDWIGGEAREGRGPGGEGKQLEGLGGEGRGEKEGKGRTGNAAAAE